MFCKFSILFALAFMSCAQHSQTATSPANPGPLSSAHYAILPDGFRVLTYTPGSAIGIVSSARASQSSIRSIASALSGEYSRIDLYIYGETDRGLEYASIIDGKLYDYDNDMISSIE